MIQLPARFRIEVSPRRLRCRNSLKFGRIRLSPYSYVTCLRRSDRGATEKSLHPCPCQNIWSTNIEYKIDRAKHDLSLRGSPQLSDQGILRGSDNPSRATKVLSREVVKGVCVDVSSAEVVDIMVQVKLRCLLLLPRCILPLLVRLYGMVNLYLQIY